ncbi:hypothetical protein Pint_28475 [Pistacia integerrima]|uniref:Uncharacterized protein n=1 Tax=Pistacia integerrima TaxID=434235 RepID=A0ACC0YN78_9ROSI|nr:hypothetical protein Pint_28475 [Pistacia integerrima]
MNEEEKGEKGPGSDSGREQEEACDVARKWRSEDDYNDRDESSSCDEFRPKNIIPESIKKTSRLALLDMDLTQVKK